MASKHKRSTIKIDGKKLKSLLENTTGKDIYTLSVENGFSRNLLNEACRKGYASVVVQNLVKLYGISPEAYAVKDPEPPKKDKCLLMISRRSSARILRILLKRLLSRLSTILTVIR